MIVLCLLDCTSTFLQPVILCHAFGSVLLLRYASACFCTCFWKISYCICTHQHSSRLYKICEICVQAYLWALSPQASEYFYRIQNTDKNATVCLCCGSNKHFWLCTNSLIGQDCFFFFFCCSLHIAERELWLSTPWGGPTVPIITVKQQCEGGILQSQKDVIEVH